MNSFKKIAVVTAAAMALVGLSTSANAAPLAVNVGVVANTTTAVAPATVAVPSLNVIDAGHSVAISAVADTGTVVTFSGNGVKLVTALNTVDAPKTVASGVSSVSATSTGVSMTVYAYTTSTTVGSVTITNGAYSTIVYIKGTAGPASNVALSLPTAVAVDTIPTIAVLATDVFGNPVGSEAISVTLIGSTFVGGAITSTVITSAVTDTSTGAVLGKGTATLTTAVAGEVTVVATGVAGAPVVTGLAAPTRSAIGKFTVSDLNAEIVKLKADVAKVTAELAAEKAARAADKLLADKALADATVAANTLVAKAKADADAAAAVYIAQYKAQYNALATKWNKAHPKAKVALIK